MIIADASGNELLDILDIDETELLESAKPLTHALAVIKVNDEYLVGWNHYRNNWEIFGGCIENNETPRECIIRECNEELGITNSEFTYLGVMKLKLMPSYFSPEIRTEYGALYGLIITDLSIDDINQLRKDKDEIDRLSFYSKINNEKIAAIDEKLLEYWT